MFEFARRVDGKYPRDGNTHSSIGVSVIGTVSVSSKEGVRAEQRLDVLQTPDLELLRVSVDDFPLEGIDEGSWVEEDGTVREASSVLLDALEVLFCDGGLTDGPGAEVHDLVAVILNFAVQVSHAGVSPVLPWNTFNIEFKIITK